MSTEPKLESVSVDRLPASASILSYRTSESHRMGIGRKLRMNMMDRAASREQRISQTPRSDPLAYLFNSCQARENQSMRRVKTTTELTSGSLAATKSTPSTCPALYMFWDRGEATQPPREASGWLTLCRLYLSIELEVYRRIRTSGMVGNELAKSSGVSLNILEKTNVKGH